MAIEIWIDDATATVTSGGTDAPEAGTVETWTITGSTLPAASSAASPPTQFYFVDPAAESEKMLVTDISGSSATVTRGASNTTPVSHSPTGFVVKQTLTAASLTGFLQLAGGTVTGDVTFTGDGPLIVGSGQFATNGAGPGTALMRLGQKDNDEVVWSFNVDQNNLDTLDDPTDSAFKFSMQGLNNSGYDGIHVQHVDAGSGTWSGAPTLFKWNGDGTFTIGAYTLPATDGTAGQVLTTDGDGNVSWQTPA